MAKENMQPVKGGDYGVKWNVKAEEFRKDAVNNYREGYYISVNEIDMQGPGRKPFNVYSFQPVDEKGVFGEMFSIASDKVLDNKLENVPLNSFVGLEYEGKKPNKTPGMNPFHSWFVGVDSTKSSYKEALEANGGVVEKNMSNSLAAAAAVNSKDMSGEHATDDDLPF